MVSRRSGGLGVNPLLQSTERPTREAEPPPAPEPVTPPAASNEYVSTRPPVHPSTGPTKFTFYFTPEQLDRLDRAWETFRRRQRGDGKRVSKSQFVRIALDSLLDEFEADPDRVLRRLQRGS